jgi:hypothetical protein
MSVIIYKVSHHAFHMQHFATPVQRRNHAYFTPRNQASERRYYGARLCVRNDATCARRIFSTVFCRKRILIVGRDVGGKITV